MAALEVLALDEATPQIRAPGAGDTYTMPRPLAITGVAGTSALTIVDATQTTSKPVLDLSQTWNAGAVTFTGLKFNVTDTASAATSLLLDLQVGGTAELSVVKNGQVLSGYTATNSPTYSFVGDTDTGWGYRSANILTAICGGGEVLRISQTQLVSFANNVNIFTTDASLTLYETTLVRDAANTLALRNSTNAQESRVYGTYTSATQYHYTAIKTAKTTLTATAGATITATNLIPDGAFLIGVTTRVNTTCTTATGYTVGDGTDVDLWGVASAVAAGTATSSADFTAAGACGLYTAAQSVVITATGGNFDGTGAIEVVAHYLTTMAD